MRVVGCGVWRKASCVLLLLVAAGVQADVGEQPIVAEQKALTAHQVLEHVSGEMLATVKDHKVSVDAASEPVDVSSEPYYAAVTTVLDRVVDFKFIARGVMGGFSRQVSPEQQQLFTEAFKQSLVVTYAKGMVGYADQEVVILPPAGDVSAQKRVNVLQEVRGADGVTRISYTMGRNRDGEWKLINVVLNGINLGKTFRGQFAQAMKTHQGDVDAVIANWAADA